MRRIFILSVLVILATNLSGQSDDPVVISDTGNTISQKPVLINVLVNDYDPDGDTIYLDKVYNPEYGDAEIISDSIIEYYSDDLFTGFDSCRYRIEDQSGNNATGYFYIYVEENPDIPLAVNDTFQLVSQIPETLEILENDHAPNGSALKIGIIGNGKYEINSDSTAIVYCSDNFSSGHAYVLYRAQETGSGFDYISDLATIYIELLDNPDIPIAYNDSAQTYGGDPVEIFALENDYDPNSIDLKIDTCLPAVFGNVEVFDDRIVYTPNFSLTGKHNLTYRVSQSEGNHFYSDYAEISVTVLKNPDCPVAINDEVDAMIYDTIAIDVMANDYDINDDEFEIFDVECDALASIAYIEDDKIRYRSAAYLEETDFITYRIREKENHEIFSEEATVTVNLSQNPELPVCYDDSVQVLAGIPVQIPVLENDDYASFTELNLYVVSSPGEKGVCYIDESEVVFCSANSYSGSVSLRYYVNAEGIIGPAAMGYIYIEVIGSNSFDSLSINNITAGVKSNGFLFNHFYEVDDFGVTGDYKAYFKYPGESSHNTIFSSTLWVGGFDDNQVLHLAGERYRQVGKDFQAGPVSDHYDMQYKIDWRRLWKVNAEEINYHKAHWQEPEYEAIEAIANWPGNGDPSYSQAEQLAPYFDFDNNGIYEANQGDYPLIRGDECIFFIVNDDMFHTETGGDSLIVEIHGMAYAYQSMEDTLLNNIIFLHYDLYNRSNLTYNNTLLGMFTDFDIGYAWDDFVGCNVEGGYYYGYNGDEVDGSGEPEAYGENPPVQLVAFLGGPFIDEDNIDNPDGLCDYSINGLNFGNGIADDERCGLTGFIHFNNSSGVQGDPYLASEYYNNLNLRWKDNTSLLYGGNGHMNSGAVGPECKFMYPDDSDSCNWGTNGLVPNGGYNQNGYYWNESTVGNNPRDIRGLGISGPFTFKPGDKQAFDLAFIVIPGQGNTNSTIDMAEIVSDTIRERIRNGRLIIPDNELGLEPSYEQEGELIIYPNPTFEKVTVMGISGFKQYVLFNGMGDNLRSGSSNKDSFTIELGSLPAGIYYLRVFNNSESYINKILKTGN